MGSFLLKLNIFYAFFKEIKTNLVLFMLAGYETTSTALTYAIYILIKHPEEQQKLIEEVDSHYSDGSVMLFFNF